MSIRTDAEASVVMTLAKGGTLHAAMLGRESTVAGVKLDRPIVWVKPMCQKSWRAESQVETFDYRYRDGRLCRHQACQRGFDQMTDSVGGDLPAAH